MISQLLSGYTLRSPQSESDFEAYFQLRWKILREPWNQEKGSEQDALEKSSFHLMICNPENKVVACGRLQFNAPELAQIRYMAVDGDERRKNLGRHLIAGLETKAFDGGAKVIFLQAREEAIPFYLSCNYEIIEKTFMLYNVIQHYSMQKVWTGIPKVI